MAWLVDNANTAYLLLGMAGLICLGLFRLNKRVVHLLWLAGVIALAALVWLLTLLVPTDRKTLESAVRTMADGVVKADAGQIFQHIGPEFQFQGMKRDELFKAVQSTIKQHQMQDIRVWELEIPELDRSAKKAKVHFKITVTGQGEQMFLARVLTDFTLVNDQWKLKTMELRQPIANTDQVIQVPLR